MGASKNTIFRFVVWPGSLPAFFSGLRVSASYAVLGAVVSEWVGSDRGLGILLIRSAKSFLTERVFSTIIVITFFSFLFVLSVEAAARLCIPWHYYKK
jgi:ABC-type nitrate/sulfonate/bicarbonate transport system permease component